MAIMLQQETTTTREFTLQFLEQITNDFSEERIIGRGGYGVVYKGVLEDGEEIALKKLHFIPGLDDKQFRNEYNNLMRAQHPNITRLVGYCYHLGHRRIKHEGDYVFAHVEERVLCFEYLQGGSLDKHISDESCGLDWHTRFKIIKGVCEGLNYLHNGSQNPIYHLDLKPENILMDKNMVPKIGDFGLSRLFSSEQTHITIKIIGTHGYMPPEYIDRYEITPKYDIFSLGVTIIRIIAGHGGYSKCAELSSEEFLEHVHENWRKRLQAKMSPHTSEQVKTCIKIALMSVKIDRAERPTIAEIVEVLKKVDTSESLHAGQALSWSASSHSWMKGDLVKLATITGREAIPDADTSSDFPVLVQVTAPPWRRVEEMPCTGIDIVVVYDMAFCWPAGYGYRRAMRIVVNKLSSNDRLSFVSVKTHPCRLTELTFMTDQGKADALGLLTVEDNYVNNDDISANIVAGLREGAQILREREGDRGVGCILLLSDRMVTMPTQHEISPEFPVHTFGLYDHSPESMKYIADQTSGTYSFFRYVQDIKDGMELFIASIVRVAATWIRITIRAHKGVAISSIESGSYGNNVRPDQLSGKIVIHDIYSGEKKNFIVYLTVAEGKKKLLTIGGRYRPSLNLNLNVTSKYSKQLPDTDVFVLRPHSRCLPAKLSVHNDVAAELARIRLLKGLLALVEPGKNLTIMHMKNLWDSVRLPMDGHGPPEETLSCLRNYVNEMKKLACLPGVNPKQVPYLMSWLSCHQWQRATTKGGSYYDSGAFTLAQPGDADEGSMYARRHNANQYAERYHNGGRHTVPAYSISLG